MNWLTSLPNLLVVVVLLYIISIAVTVIYNLTFHPLAKFPGPKFRAAFDFPNFWELCLGVSAAKIKVLHDKYGHTVRISPNQLSFSSAQAWRDIYTAGKGQKGLQRDPGSYPPNRRAADIMIANDADHTRMRKLMAHAFSESSLREQEPLIHSYCDLLIKRLYDQIKGPRQGDIDIVGWLNFTTFDIIGDLQFGEPFGGLEQGEYHFWISTTLKGMRMQPFMRSARAYPPLEPFLRSLLSLFPSASKLRAKYEGFAREKTKQRLARNTDRRDFMTSILRHNDEKGMTEDEMVANSTVLLVGGSETTATLLSGLIFHLLKTPRVLEKLQNEIRDAFNSPSEMTFLAEAKLPYIQACIEEALRLYPPVAGTMPRYTPPSGITIDGKFVPGNTVVGVHHLSASRSSRNFKDPMSFAPERWIGDERFAGDDLAAAQPFSMGARGCIGKTLAYAEMRSILTRIIWSFDMELKEDSHNWDEQKVFTFWQKAPLNVKLSPGKLE